MNLNVFQQILMNLNGFHGFLSISMWHPLKTSRLHIPQAKCNFKMLDAGADCDVAGSISRVSEFPAANLASCNSTRLHVSESQCNLKMLDACADRNVTGNISRVSAYPRASAYPQRSGMLQAQCNLKMPDACADRNVTGNISRVSAYTRASAHSNALK